MSPEYHRADRVIIIRPGRLHGRAGVVVDVDRHAARELDVLTVDLGTLRVPCCPDEVRSTRAS